MWVGDEKSVSSVFCLTGDDRQGNAPHYPEATVTNQSHTAEVKGIASFTGSKHGGKLEHRRENDRDILQ